jgi:hypothetical protein
MAQLNVNSSQTPPILRIEPFKGINLSVTPTQIGDNQAADMLNMNTDERGAISKRKGYERVFANPLGAGKVNGIFEFRKPDGTAEMLFAHGSHIYRMNGDTPEVIYTGLSPTLTVSTFSVGGKMYFMNGVSFFRYDGATFQAIPPYIPTLTISGKPGDIASGLLLEDFNLLGSGFKETFSGDGVGNVFKLAFYDLDTAMVKVKVNNVDLTEGIDFTVTHSFGSVSFLETPSIGTNNVEITAYKTQAGFPERISKCTMSTLFGGDNDTRVFVSGNPDSPNTMWRSGLFDPTYFPENGFYQVGSDRERIMGFAKQYDYLVIEKESSKGNMQYRIDVNGEATFPIKPLNDQIGTLASRSIQIVENNPVSLGRTGVYMLTSSNVRDERNIQHISANVDALLLKEPNLDKAISVDYDRKYWLAVNGKVYIYNYTMQEWYIYDNIHASCFLEYEGALYFGDNGAGMLYRFKTDSDLYPYNDDGIPIQAYWKSKYFTFGADEALKAIDKVFFSMKPAVRTSVDVSYATNKKTSGLIKSKRMDQLDFFTFNFNFFSFIRSSFPQESMVKVKVKKITHFQLIFKNAKMDESMSILSTGIKYRYGSDIK